MEGLDFEEGENGERIVRKRRQITPEMEMQMKKRRLPNK
jgi:hypothetical protein